MNESEFHSIFREFLIKEKGYPSISLLSEFRAGDRNIIDILAAKEGTSSPIALFELKKKDRFNASSASEQIQRYLDELSVEIPAYLVAFSDDGAFEIHAYKGSKKFEEISKNDFPDYENITTKKSVEDLNRIEKKKKKSLDGFQRACYGLAFLVAGTLVSKKAGWITLTSEDLALIGVIVALVIIPNAAKLKLLGIEYEAKKADRDRTAHH